MLMMKENLVMLLMLMTTLDGDVGPS